MSDQGLSDSDESRRDVPSWVEPRPPLVLNPFMRPRPQKGTNLLDLFEDSDLEEQDWVQVYLRLKPCNIPSNLYEVRNDRCLITSVDTATAGHGRRTQHNVSKMYTFSKIFGSDSSQKEIFEQVVKENLRKLPEGHNFTLLTYGASGSGKTYTLMGTVASPGLVPRSLEYVFRIVDAAQQPLFKPSEEGSDRLCYNDQDFELQWVRRLRNVSAPLREKYRRMSSHLRNDMTSTLDLSNRTRYYVWVSFVEIYNEGIYDLLVNTDRSKAISKLRIREDSSGNAYCKGATQAFVRSGEEAYDVMVAGKHNLQVAATGVHANSSRSHCIFTITLLTETESGVRTSYVRLCDLAGSERARATQNTGARMMESRSINASLHVLERCLHSMRRKQRVDATLVPYRESKLTRLLGAGLSGARGEAVSMVVTLNPSPQYAHETKHVLQLAAVAKDIQINHTIAEQISSFESTQDTSIGLGEVMKLRAENERLHFELIHAQSRNKELLASMAEKQQEVAATMSELVAEAKDITRKYYESQLDMLRTEMEEMKEDYEARLKVTEISDAAKIRLSANDGTPSKTLQKKIAQLITECAILEEKLANEKLARQRVEEEIQHLRACIEERDDEKGNSTNEKEDTSDESCEHDNENESLEPSFKKEEIKRTKLIRQSLNRSNLINDYVCLKQLGIEKFNKSLSFKEDDECIESVDSDPVDSRHVSVLEVSNDSNDTLKDDDDVHNVTKPLEISGEINDESFTVENDVAKTIASNNSGYATDTSTNNVTKGNKDINNVVQLLVINENASDNSADSENCQNKSNIKKVTSNNSLTRGTYFVRESQSLNYSKDSTKSTGSVTNFCDDHVPEINRSGSSTRSLTRDTYFVKESEIFNTSELDKSNNSSKSSSRETYFVKDKIFLNEMLSKSAENEKSNKPLEEKRPGIKMEEKIPAIVPETIVKKLVCNSKRQNQTSDVSLAQFEQLEMTANSTPVERLSDTFPSMKISQEKPHKYFDDKRMTTDLLKVQIPKDKTHFNIADKSEPENPGSVNDDRSPSIVKDDVAESFEPSIIKKLLGESLTRPEVLPVHVALPKKNYSMDIFEGFDSPGVVKTKMDAVDTSLVMNTNLKVNTNERIETVEKTNINIEHTKNLYDTLAEKNTTPEDVLKMNIGKTIQLNEPLSTEKDELLKVKKEKIDFDFIRPAAGKPRPVSILENCVERADVSKINDGSKLIDDARKCIDDMVQYQKSHSLKEIKIKVERTSISEYLNKMNEPELETTVGRDVTSENTLEEFEKIAKTVTPRTTEFELIVSQNVNSSNEMTEHNTETEKRNADKKAKEFERVKYNLRQKHNISEDKSDEPIEIKTDKKPKRNLRLRRRKNETDDEVDTKMIDKKGNQLKDIVNLQKEFSDVTLDVPAPKKVVKDIISPEKEQEDQENLHPHLGVQSCPSKSVTRSRRKLFTPRAEPLEESLTQSGGADERVRVPRPSYHRPRARRKL